MASIDFKIGEDLVELQLNLVSFNNLVRISDFIIRVTFGSLVKESRISRVTVTRDDAKTPFPDEESMLAELAYEYLKSKS